jgi:hypothetical protein
LISRPRKRSEVTVGVARFVVKVVPAELGNEGAVGGLLSKERRRPAP